MTGLSTGLDDVGCAFRPLGPSIDPMTTDLRHARGTTGPRIVPGLSADCTETGDTHMEREPSLRRVASGVYVPAQEWAEGSVEARHLALIEAAAAKYGDGLVLAGPSAALVLGLPLVGGVPSLVQCVGVHGQRRRTSLLRRHDREGADVVVAGQYRCTGAAATCVDLARWGGLVQGVCAMDHALRVGATTRSELEAALEALGTARHTGVARTAVRLADPRSESPGESLSRVRMWRARLPEPKLQHEVWTRVGLVRADYFWPEPGVVAEFDGALKYRRSSFGQAAEDVVWHERERERALRRLGLEIARWTWNEAWYDDGARMVCELVAVGVCPGARRW